MLLCSLSYTSLFLKTHLFLVVTTARRHTIKIQIAETSLLNKQGLQTAHPHPWCLTRIGQALYCTVSDLAGGCHVRGLGKWISSLAPAGIHWNGQNVAIRIKAFPSLFHQRESTSATDSEPVFGPLAQQTAVPCFSSCSKAMWAAAPLECPLIVITVGVSIFWEYSASQIVFTGSCCVVGRSHKAMHPLWWALWPLKRGMFLFLFALHWLTYNLVQSDCCTVQNRGGVSGGLAW